MAPLADPVQWVRAAGGALAPALSLELAGEALGSVGAAMAVRAHDTVDQLASQLGPNWIMGRKAVRRFRLRVHAIGLASIRADHDVWVLRLVALRAQCDQIRVAVRAAAATMDDVVYVKGFAITLHNEASMTSETVHVFDEQPPCRPVGRQFQVPAVEAYDAAPIGTKEAQLKRATHALRIFDVLGQPLLEPRQGSCRRLGAEVNQVAPKLGDV